MKELSLHILDLSQNSVAAGAALLQITIDEDLSADLLTIVIEDDGCGMDQAMVERVKDPFVTTRKSRKVGLGIPLMLAACQRCEGSLVIESQIGVGTKLTATMKYSHIDRTPLGNMAETIVTMILCGHNEKGNVEIVYRHSVDKREFCFDTREIKRILGSDVSLGEPDVLAWINVYINEGLENIRGGV